MATRMFLEIVVSLVLLKLQSLVAKAHFRRKGRFSGAVLQTATLASIQQRFLEEMRSAKTMDLQGLSAILE